jgi:hypothetical protein
MRLQQPRGAPLVASAIQRTLNLQLETAVAEKVRQTELAAAAVQQQKRARGGGPLAPLQGADAVARGKGGQLKGTKGKESALASQLKP